MSIPKKQINSFYKVVRKNVRDTIIFTMRLVLKFKPFSNFFKRIISVSPSLYRKLDMMVNSKSITYNDEMMNYMNEIYSKPGDLQPGAKKIYYDIQNA